MRAEPRRDSQDPVTASAPRPERLLFVYNSASRVLAMLADAVKEAAGVEECALCEITHSPLGKRSEWARCERGLGIPIAIVHRDELPVAWKVDLRALPMFLRSQVKSDLRFCSTSSRLRRVLAAWTHSKRCCGGLSGLVEPRSISRGGYHLR